MCGREEEEGARKDRGRGGGRENGKRVRKGRGGGRRRREGVELCSRFHTICLYLLISLSPPPLLPSLPPPASSLPLPLPPLPLLPSLSPPPPSSPPSFLCEDLDVRENYKTYWASPYSGITGSVRRESLPPTNWRKRRGEKRREKEGGGGRKGEKRGKEVKGVFPAQEKHLHLLLLI